MYDITVGTVVNVDVHRMVLLDLHTAGDTGRGRVTQVETFKKETMPEVMETTFGQICVGAGKYDIINKQSGDIWSPQPPST